MNAHRIAFKFFLEHPEQIDRERLVPMFLVLPGEVALVPFAADQAVFCI